MKIQAACVLAILLAVAPDLFAQRGGRGGGGGPGGGGPGGGGPGAGAPGGGPGGGGPGGGGGRGGAGGGRGGGGATPSVPVQRAVNGNLPSSPILPISNPVAPIANPVAPVVPYGGAPGLGVPARGPVSGRSDFQRIPDRNNRRRDDVIFIGAPYVDPFYYSPYYYPPYYYQPYMTPAPIPGQLPGVYFPPDPAPAAAAEPIVYSVPPSAGGGGGGADFEPATFVSEPRMIISPPEPDRPVEPPPTAGTTRAEVLMRYGQPWGSISAQGKETLYFRSMTVVLESGKVTEVR